MGRRRSHIHRTIRSRSGHARGGDEDSGSYISNQTTIGSNTQEWVIFQILIFSFLFLNKNLNFPWIYKLFTNIICFMGIMIEGLFVSIEKAFKIALNFIPYSILNRKKRKKSIKKLNKYFYIKGRTWHEKLHKKIKKPILSSKDTLNHPKLKAFKRIIDIEEIHNIGDKGSASHPDREEGVTSTEQLEVAVATLEAATKTAEAT